MKPAWAVGIGIALTATAFAAAAQSPQPTAIEPAQAAAVFAQARALCAGDGGRLWDASLCAPVMLVDPRSRAIVASQADAGGVLRAEGEVFVGTLPAKDNAANTATHWSGTHWTQLLWPLPEDASQRSVLIAHELFHRVQPQLRVARPKGGDNAHLDTLEGRYLLQLEWRALAAALQAGDAPAERVAIADALAFRAERYRLFANAGHDEAALELNEGLAEYTGVMVGAATPQARVQAALRDLGAHVADPSFVRSFAYATGPAYGLLLDRHAAGWRGQLASATDLSAPLAAAVREDPRADSTPLPRRAARYQGAALRGAEQTREVARKQAFARNLARFVEGPVVNLPLRHMKIQFDPRNPQPLGEHGTVYPTLRISDDWGNVEASDGALMKPDWRTLILVAPADAEHAGEVSGVGWTLRLKPGWRLVRGARPGDWTLAQREQ